MTRYLSVATSKPEQVPAYLYGGVTILLSARAADYAPMRTVLVLHSQDNDTAYDQRDRLSSGLHGARVFDTLADAMTDVADWLVPSKYDASL